MKCQIRSLSLQLAYNQLGDLQMKKTIMILMIAAFGISFCGKKSGIAEVKTLFDNATVSIDKAAADFKNSKDGKAAAVAAEAFYTAISSFKEQAEALDKKYPDLKNAEKSQPELEAALEKFQKATENFMMVLQQDMTKAGSVEVQEIMKKLSELK